MRFSEVIRTPIADKSRQFATASSAPEADDQITEHGRILRVFTPGVHHARWTEDPIRGGDFDRIYGQVWALTQNTLSGLMEGDIEGASLRRLGPWREGGSAGAITLNKTSPLHGLRDALMSHADSDTRFSQLTWRPLKLGVSYRLQHFYKHSVTANPHEISIRYWAATKWRYRSGAATWSDTETWVAAATATSKATSNLQFTPEAKARHVIAFRPGAAATVTTEIANVYIVEDALSTDPKLGAGFGHIFRADGEGRFSFLTLADDATGVVDISEVGE